MWEQDSSDIMWQTADRGSVRIGDMSLGHIHNCIKLLEQRLNEEDNTMRRGQFMKYISAFLQELEKRGDDVSSLSCV